jgi:hypothetical protein
MTFSAFPIPAVSIDYDELVSLVDSDASTKVGPITSFASGRFFLFHKDSGRAVIWQDDGGEFRFAGSVEGGAELKPLMVSVTANSQIQVYRPLATKDSTVYVRHTFLYRTNQNSVTWHWSDMSLVRKDGDFDFGGDAARLIGAGIQDIIMQVATYDDSGTLRDVDTDTALDPTGGGWVGVGHSQETLLSGGFVVYVDGVPIDTSVTATYYAAQVQIRKRAYACLELSSAVADPASDTNRAPVIYNTEWTMDEKHAISARLSIEFRRNVTMNFVNFGQFTFEGGNATALGFKTTVYLDGPSPTTLTLASVATSTDTDGARRAVYQGANGVVEIEVSRPGLWPSGEYRNEENRLEPADEYHQEKADPSWKSYFRVLPELAVTEPEGSFYRALSGEVWERTYSVGVRSNLTTIED